MFIESVGWVKQSETHARGGGGFAPCGSTHPAKLRSLKVGVTIKRGWDLLLPVLSRLRRGYGNVGVRSLT
jgi:hypothetical protein